MFHKPLSLCIQGKKKKRKVNQKTWRGAEERFGSVLLLRARPGEIEQSGAKSSRMFWNGLMLPPFEVNSLSLGYLIRWPRSMAQTHPLPRTICSVAGHCTENEIKSLSSSSWSYFIPICLPNLTQCKDQHPLSCLEGLIFSLEDDQAWKQGDTWHGKSSSDMQHAGWPQRWTCGLWCMFMSALDFLATGVVI